MPGKMESSNLYTYIGTLQKLRSVTSADTESQAGIISVEEKLNLGLNDRGEAISIGRGNALGIGVLLGAGVSAATVSTYVNIGPGVDAAEAWARVDQRSLNFSSMFTLENIYPGEVKVLITAMTGTGTVTIACAKSA